MRGIVFNLSLVVVLVASGGPAQAQDGWWVYGYVDITEVAEPTNNDIASTELWQQPKVAHYPELATVSSPSIGSATFDYSKDADPFGHFWLTVDNDIAGDIRFFGYVGHGIEPVEGPGWKVQCWLTIELIDRNADGVSLTAPIHPLMRMFVQDANESWPQVDGMDLGTDLDLQGAGEYHLDAGVLAYAGPAAHVMEGNFYFDLSAGDRAIIVGRFEFSQDLTPVEQATWSGVKDLFD